MNPQSVVLTAKPVIWDCPNCREMAQTVTAKVPWHHCRGLKGLFSPLIRKGERARIRPLDREDFVGHEVVQTDGDGRPVMALDIERPDGSNDRVVYAPLATSLAEAN